MATPLTRPTKEGFYWYEDTIVRLFRDSQGFLDVVSFSEYDDYILEEMNLRWYGPIKRPTEVIE